MNSYETIKAVRRASHAQSSFPRFVADLIIAACNRGATTIEVRTTHNGLQVNDNGRTMLEEQVVEALSFAGHVGVLVGFLHHAQKMQLSTGGKLYFVEPSDFGRHDVPYEVISERHTKWYSTSVELSGLGKGDGINPHQDYTIKRLMQRLPPFLSTREEGRVTLHDGKSEHRLSTKSRDPLPFNDEYLVWLPLQMVSRKSLNSASAPLLLKVGGVRVPLRKVLERVEKEELGNAYIACLCSPWLSGIIEITRVDGATEVLQESDDFTDEMYETGYVKSLVSTLLAVRLDDVVRREITDLLHELLDDAFGDERSTEFEGKRIVFDVCNRTSAAYPVQASAYLVIRFGSCAPVYHVDNHADAVIERMYWQAAILLWELGDKHGTPDDLYLRFRKSVV